MNKKKSCHQKVINIKGMHCRSCELLVEDNLLTIPGVQKARVDHRKGTAVITYEKRPDESAIISAVRSSGYEVGNENLPLISRDLGDYINLVWAGFILVAVYTLIRALGVNDLFSVSGDYSSLWIVLLVGLTAGFSSCMAMVGGLVLGLSAKFSENRQELSLVDKFKPHLVFNASRIISYSFFGGLIGMAGSAFQLSTRVSGLITLLAALLMVILGAQLIEIFPKLKKISFSIPKKVTRALGVKDLASENYSHRTAMILGALTFFLPCGFTQAMQIYAISTGSILSGALTMGVFALGTAPGLLSVGGLTSLFKGQKSKIIFQTAGLVVIVLSLINFNGGLTLLGAPNFQSVLGYFKSQEGQSSKPEVPNPGKPREIRMTQNASGYSPNYFVVQKDVPIRWVINSTNAFSCASSLIVPQLKIRKNLSPGENVIEFTPTQTGNISFSCSMGMYSGIFKVVEKI